MPLPRTIVKPTLPLVPKKELSARREQLLEYIKEDGTYLPKSVLHADLDRGMLDFVKTELEVVTAGKIVPMLDIIITTQNWSQYLETWKFVDLDFNLDNLKLSMVQTHHFNIQFQIENNFIMPPFQLGMVMNKVWTFIQFHNLFLLISNIVLKLFVIE